MVQKRKLYGSSRTVSIVKDEINLVAWIERGKLRKNVFLSIGERTMPSKIVDHITQGRKSASLYAQVSRALKELQFQSLITCLTPKEKTGRLYALTKKGEELLRKISAS
ncbi:MAG: hypothetical protein Q8R53_01930 [Nanoarchaeota archaeon]|nr:hypothetical protein [Nanoarchaeota archaeon]